MVLTIFLLIVLLFGWFGVIATLYILVRVIPALFLGLLFLYWISNGVNTIQQTKQKKEAEQMRINGEISGAKAVNEYKEWKKWYDNLTTKQRDSIKRSEAIAIENTKIRCVKCKRELKNVDVNDYIKGVGQACTKCYIKDYIKKHKK